VRVPLEHYEAPRPQEIRGVIVCGTFDDRYIEMFRSQNVPIVVVDYCTTDTQSDCVTIDLLGEARTVITRLGRLGHSTLAFLAAARRDPRTGEHEHDPDTWELLDGLRRAGLRHGIRIENEWAVTAPSTGEPMRQAIDGFLSLRRRPSAALCFDCDVALPMLEAMRNASIDCPANFSVITRGPSSDQRIAANRLAYLRNNPELMGQLAVRMLMERIRGHRRDAVRLAVASRWIPGDSVGPPDLPE
jgi:LacI family transcriptional regulator